LFLIVLTRNNCSVIDRIELDEFLCLIMQFVLHFWVLA